MLKTTHQTGLKLPSSIYLEHVQVVLFGRGGSGKTSLVKSLQGETFNLNLAITSGVDIQETPIGFCGITNKRIDLWDFAGQVITHPLHNLFLNKSAIYLIVLTGNRDRKIEDFSKWIKTIITNSKGEQHGQSKIIIVNNKFESPSDEKIRLDLVFFRNLYPDLIHSQIDTDCQTGLGIDQLKESLNTSIQSLKPKVITPEYQKAYIKVEECLKTSLTGTEFLKVLNDAGISQVDEQIKTIYKMRSDGLITTLDLDEKDLQACTITNPLWFTKALYGVIRFGEASGGIISQKNFQAKFSNYTQADLDLIINQLKKLELAFIDDSTKQIIIPLAMENYTSGEIRKKFPTFFNPTPIDFYDKDKIKIRFSFEKVDPEKLGLIARLAVRNHKDIKIENIWDTAVLLERDGVTAFIQLPYNERQIQISLIEGNIEDRRKFARDIYEQITEICKMNTISEFNAELCIPQGWISIPGLLINKLSGKKSTITLLNSVEGTELVNPKVYLTEIGYED